MTSQSTEAPTWPRDGYDEEWLALEDAAGGRYILPTDISECVAIFNTTFAAISKTWPPLEEPLEVWDDNTGSEYGNMPARFYQPKSDKPLPLMVLFHGGGFVAGNLDTEDYQCRYFAAKTPCLVVSIDYPLTPGVSMDEMIEHAVMATKWARLKAPSHNSDPSRTLLCGGSAGAVLTAQVAYNFMAAGQHDVISGCMMLYVGVLHWDYDGKYKHMHRSWEDNGHAQVPVFGLDVAKAVWEPLDPRPTDPRHFVGVAEDLSKFPPCYLLSAEKDCFRDDGKVMELRLKEAGVKCRFDYYQRLPHWFHTFPQLNVAHDMMRKTVEGARFLLEE